MQSIIYRMDKQQGIWHRELYLMSLINHDGKEYEKEYTYIHVCIYIYSAEINTTL